MDEEKSRIEQLILEFVGKNSHADLSKVTSRTMLFGEGIFDSMGFVLLVDYLEEKFGIKIEDKDLTEENFESISAIIGFIVRKNAVKVV